MACATGNFNHQILPYGILFLTCISTTVFIHSRIYPARDVVQSVWYNISALIRCNFIIKNYVNRKIMSYIYLLIFTISFFHKTNEFIIVVGGGEVSTYNFMFYVNVRRLNNCQF
jgi:hypothetical protein